MSRLRSRTNRPRTPRPPILHRSINTERALHLPRPRWRGLSHLVAAVVTLPAGVWVTLQAAPGAARVATGVFAVCIWAMFTVSAVVHRRRWPARVTEMLFRLDHTAIFLAIAGSATPLAVLGLDGWLGTVLLVGVWTGAAIGILVTWLPFPPPRGFANTVFLTLGWLVVPLVPAIWRHAGPATVAWLAAGGLLYTIGAVVVGLRRPDPAPHAFGYHEVWHLFVVAAAASHYVMVAGTLLPPNA